MLQKNCIFGEEKFSPKLITRVLQKPFISSKMLKIAASSMHLLPCTKIFAVKFSPIEATGEN